MAKNKMNEVAKLLGLELEEEFRIKYDNKAMYVLKEDGFFEVVGRNTYLQRDIDNLLNGELEVVKLPKQILDEKEKEYLSAVIKPFRDSVVAIVKRGDYGCDNYSCIRIIVEQNGNLDWISLPIFKTETMYNGMKIDKEYTLNELGL